MSADARIMAHELAHVRADLLDVGADHAIVERTSEQVLTTIPQFADGSTGGSLSTPQGLHHMLVTLAAGPAVDRLLERGSDSPGTFVRMVAADGLVKACDTYQPLPNQAGDADQIAQLLEMLPPGLVDLSAVAERAAEHARVVLSIATPRGLEKLHESITATNPLVVRSLSQLGTFARDGRSTGPTKARLWKAQKRVERARAALG